MKFGKFLIPLLLFSALLIILSACSPSRISVDEYNHVTPGAATPEPQITEEVVSEADTAEEPAPVEEDQGNGLDDVPIMDGAYQVQKGRTGKNVVYQVDSTIDEVVIYYQGELPNHEWEMAGPADNAVASIATMLRENAAGDRLAINMQRNDLGGFVRITITISRAD